MSAPCTHCNATLVAVDDVQGLVCPQCGALADPSQTVLADASNGAPQYLPQPTLTLKSIRSANWNLAGQQGKESRDRKNTFAIAAYINSLAVSLNATGLSPRAITLFNQARSASPFRWGKPARSVAGACLAIALREATKPDSLRDISEITGTPYLALTRAFRDITAVLNISTYLVDPSVHLTLIHTHLARAIQDPPSNNASLPVALVNQLRTVSLHSANRSAIQLSKLLSRLAPEHEVSQLPGAPTAGAIFILALESESRATISHLADLANYLASRLHSTKSTVMSRYKLIQDQIAIWIGQVPWLDKYEAKPKRSGAKGDRAKVAKRLVVARGLRDVIAFQESEWLKKPRPELNLIEEEAEASEGTNDPQGQARSPPFVVSRPRKRRRLDKDHDSETLARARQFLLDPLTPLSATSSTPCLKNTLSRSVELLLTLSSPTPLTTLPRTRLQRLALERGGSSKDRIPDDDLFEPGEMENLLRSSDEIGVLKEHFEWRFAADVDNNDDNTSGSQSNTTGIRTTIDGNGPRRKDAPASGVKTRKGTSRINVAALAQFYQSVASNGVGGMSSSPSSEPLQASIPDDDGDLDAGLMGFQLIMDDEEGQDYADDAQHHPPTSTPAPNTLQEYSDPEDDEGQQRSASSSTKDGNDEEVEFSRHINPDDDEDDPNLDEWWPSPLGGSRSANNLDDECRYQQEYD